MAKYLNQDIGHVLLPQLKKITGNDKTLYAATCSHLRLREYSPLVDLWSFVR